MHRRLKYQKIYVRNIQKRAHKQRDKKTKLLLQHVVCYAVDLAMENLFRCLAIFAAEPWTDGHWLYMCCIIHVETPSWALKLIPELATNKNLFLSRWSITKGFACIYRNKFPSLKSLQIRLLNICAKFNEHISISCSDFKIHASNNFTEIIGKWPTSS
jgi:hypothetical protein